MPSHLKEEITEGQAILVDCPAFLGHDGATRCGLPAEVEARYTVRSTDGPLESARIRCPRGHWFNGPIESLRFTGEEMSDVGLLRQIGAVPSPKL